MSKRFITFQPVTGIYEKAIQPYKKWYELADMSPLIEVDGEYYRILIITGRIKKTNIRKMVISHENGKLVKDETLSRKCSRVLHYLNSFEINSNGMILSSKDDTPTKLGEFITEFKKMMENAAPQLTKEELKAMSSQLYYYEETMKYSKIVAREANQLKTYIQPLKKNQMDNFSAFFLDTLGEHLGIWEENKRYIQALLIENDRKVKQIVRKILKNPDYQTFFPNQKLRKEMTDEMLQSEMAVTRFIHDAKRAWEREKKFLNPSKGKFNLETYLDETWNRNNNKLFIKINTNEFIEDYWIFSPTRIHS